MANNSYQSLFPATLGVPTLFIIVSRNQEANSPRKMVKVKVKLTFLAPRAGIPEATER